jgi:microcystin-dependent protein
MEEDCYIGEIRLVAFNYDPIGFFPCNGGELDISKYAPLYALLGCTFGGDGRSKFNLPKLESPMKGLHYVICYNGLWPTRP